MITHDVAAKISTRFKQLNNPILSLPDTSTILGRRDQAILELRLLGISTKQVNMLDIHNFDPNHSLIYTLRRNSEKRFISLDSQSLHAMLDYKDFSRPSLVNPAKPTEALFLNWLGGRLSTRGLSDVFNKYIKQLGFATTHKSIPSTITALSSCDKRFIEQFNFWSTVPIVYFARLGNGYIKIGFSERIWQRFQGLHVEYGEATLLGLIQGDKTLEAKLHNQFRDDCIGGEMFRPSDVIINFIENLTK